MIFVLSKAFRRQKATMSKHTKAYLALIFICIVWGTTYLAIRVGVLHFPAFLFAAIRQLISGVIIMAIGLMMSRTTDLSLSNLKHQALIGFLLITMGNGLVTWGEKYVPSGVAALICSLMPIIAVIVNLFLSKKEKVNAPIIIGMVIGFAGVGLIFKDDVSEITNTRYVLGAAATFVATSSWAAGSVFNKKRISLVNPVFNAGLQLLFGGIFLLAASPLVDNYTGMNLWHPDVIWSLLYLIVFGSVAAYTAYMFALKELPVGIVTLYAYVNPLVAVLLGYLVLSEPLTWITALAFISIVGGVYIVNYGYRKQHRQRQANPGDNKTNALPNTNTR
jgi:drug/metabolite transporter (DMT)-like permease